VTAGREHRYPEPQPGPSAPEHARRSARRPRARRRDRHRRAPRHRLPAPRHREACRAPHVPPDHRAHGPPRLPGGPEQQPGLRPDGRKTHGPGGPPPRPIRAGGPGGAAAHREPPVLAGHARPRPRGHDAPVLRPARAGSPHGHLRKSIGFPPDAELSAGRGPCRRHRRAVRRVRAELHGHLPGAGGRVRDTADAKPDLEVPDERGRRPRRGPVHPSRHLGAHASQRRRAPGSPEDATLLVL